MTEECTKIPKHYGTKDNEVADWCDVHGYWTAECHFVRTIDKIDQNGYCEECK